MKYEILFEFLVQLFGEVYNFTLDVYNNKLTVDLNKISYIQHFYDILNKQKDYYAVEE